MKYFIISLMCVFILGGMSAAQRDLKTEMVNGHTMYIVLDKGMIPGIYNPEYVSADQAKEFYFDNEPLMIVNSGNETHAYSIWHLDHHEIVNDKFGDTPITATW